MRQRLDLQRVWQQTEESKDLPKMPGRQPEENIAGANPAKSTPSHWQVRVVAKGLSG
jgi:hypothetical protein